MDLQRPWPLMLNRDRDVETSKLDYSFWVSGLEGFWCGFTEALAFNVKPRPRCRNFQARLLFLGFGPRGLLVWIYRGLVL